MDFDQGCSGSQPDRGEMMRLRTRLVRARWVHQTLLGVAILLFVLVVACPGLKQMPPDGPNQASTVEVLRYKFYDDCFYATIDSAVETATDIGVQIKIKHLQSSGRCGCRSALMKVKIYAEVDVYVPPDNPLGGKEPVGTTPPFSNTLEAYALTIKKHRPQYPQDYKLWLACAD